MIIWNKLLGQYGHVAVFLEGDNKKFKSFDQNYPVGSACHIQDHDYKAVMGWLRPKMKGDFMKFDLFRDTRDGRVFVRLWNNELVHIPSQEELTKYFGDNPAIKDVGDYEDVGWIPIDKKNALEDLVEAHTGTQTALSDYRTEVSRLADLNSQIGPKLIQCQAERAGDKEEIKGLKIQLEMQGKEVEQVLKEVNGANQSLATELERVSGNYDKLKESSAKEIEELLLKTNDVTRVTSEGETMLKGYRTYLAVGFAFVAEVLTSTGVLPEDLRLPLVALFLAAAAYYRKQA